MSRFRLLPAVMLLAGGIAHTAIPAEPPTEASGTPPLSTEFATDVHPLLAVPDSEQAQYADRLSNALASLVDKAQYVILVDRSPVVQALLLYWFGPDHVYRFVGASPVSTGKPGRFEHFITPLGVFGHSLANLDFRSRGTKNKNGIRGYGVKGMRIYDFGWQKAERGWGKGGESKMRLQMHSTDPGILEKRLGTPQSDGCIRISATLNTFIDHYGILDAAYDEAIAHGTKFWMLPKDREPTDTPGKYLVIVDSGGTQRPEWAHAGGPGSGGHPESRHD